MYYDTVHKFYGIKSQDKAFQILSNSIKAAATRKNIIN